MKPGFSHSIAAAAVALLLAGCGGGGGGSAYGTVGATSDTGSGSTSPVVTAPPPLQEVTVPGTGNVAPVANAGTAQTVTLGATAALDGSASSDADGNPLTYVWTLTTKPAKSNAALTGMTSAAPTFVADVSGAYEATLIVNDGKLDSAAATVKITVPDVWTDFSDNGASVTLVQDNGAGAIQLETTATPKAPGKSHNTGITGNRANLAMDFLNGVKLADFKGISFKARDDGAGAAAAGAGLPYVNYTISKNCDGTGWANLITNVTDMSPSQPDADGYVTYTATIDATSTAWKSSSYTTPISDLGGTTVLPANAALIGTSLQALITAYPNACIYNWPNPDALVPLATKTPAVMIMLGNSKNENIAKKTWFKDITVNGQVVF